MFVEIYQMLNSSVYSVSLIIGIAFFDIFIGGRWFSSNRKRARRGRTFGQIGVFHGYTAVLSACHKSQNAVSIYGSRTDDLVQSRR
jgi:hypothetical protein